MSVPVQPLQQYATMDAAQWSSTKKRLRDEDRGTYKRAKKARRAEEQRRWDEWMRTQAVEGAMHRRRQDRKFREVAWSCPVPAAWYRPAAGQSSDVPHLHVQTVFDLYNIADREYPDEATTCATLEEYSPSQAWYDATKDYYASLDAVTRSCLFNYTHHGDRVINAFLRGGAQAGVTAARQYRAYPFMDALVALLPTSGGDVAEQLTAAAQLSQSRDASTVTDTALGENLAAVADIIQRAIRGAPPLDRPCLVFRGIQDRDGEYNAPGTVVAQGLVSVTNHPMTALSFANDGKVLRLFLDAGVRVLPLLNSQLDEAELLLPHGTALRVVECDKYRTAWHRQREGQLMDVCDVEVRADDT